DEDPPLLRIVESHQQTDDGRLSSAGVADDRQRLSRPRREAYVAKYPFGLGGGPGRRRVRAVVRKPDVLEFDEDGLWPLSRQVRVTRNLHPRLRVQQMKDPLR